MLLLLIRLMAAHLTCLIVRLLKNYFKKMRVQILNFGAKRENLNYDYLAPCNYQVPILTKE